MFERLVKGQIWGFPKLRVNSGEVSGETHYIFIPDFIIEY